MEIKDITKKTAVIVRTKAEYDRLKAGGMPICDYQGEFKVWCYTGDRTYCTLDWFQQQSGWIIVESKSINPHKMPYQCPFNVGEYVKLSTDTKKHSDMVNWRDDRGGSKDEIGVILKIQEHNSNPWIQLQMCKDLAQIIVLEQHIYKCGVPINAPTSTLIPPTHPELTSKFKPGDTVQMTCPGNATSSRLQSTRHGRSDEIGVIEEIDADHYGGNSTVASIRMPDGHLCVRTVNFIRHVSTVSSPDIKQPLGSSVSQCGFRLGDKVVMKTHGGVSSRDHLRRDREAFKGEQGTITGISATPCWVEVTFDSDGLRAVRDDGEIESIHSYKNTAGQLPQAKTPPPQTRSKYKGFTIGQTVEMKCSGGYDRDDKPMLRWSRHANAGEVGKITGIHEQALEIQLPGGDFVIRNEDFVILVPPGTPTMYFGTPGVVPPKDLADAFNNTGSLPKTPLTYKYFEYKPTSSLVKQRDDNPFFDGVKLSKTNKTKTKKVWNVNR